MAEILILGGGVAGISAAHHAGLAGHEAVIFEARERWGGLLDHFKVDGFRFDNAVHFAFSGNEPYSQVLAMTDCIRHRPEPYNYEQGRWLKHPVQNNLYPLPAEEKAEAIVSFVNRPDQTADPDYRQWLTQQFGEVIAERFPCRYTEKYWTVPAERMGTEWIGNRLYRPTLNEVLFGAMTDRTPLTYYLPELLYPRRGGFRALLEPLRQGLDLRTGKKAVHIDAKKRYVECSDGTREHYRLLASSAPLPELVEMLDEAPAAVRQAAASLWASSIALVSLGFNRPREHAHLWFYIYDQEILPSRVHAPHRKSPDNAPPGCSSFQFETYYSRHKPLAMAGDTLVEHVVDAMARMGLATKEEIVAVDYRTLPYANVVFDRGMVERRDFVLEYVKSCGILPIGRFGEWDYLWTDQSYLSGGKIARELYRLES